MRISIDTQDDVKIIGLQRVKPPTHITKAEEDSIMNGASESFPFHSANQTTPIKDSNITSNITEENRVKMVVGSRRSVLSPSSKPDSMMHMQSNDLSQHASVGESNGLMRRTTV